MDVPHVRSDGVRAAAQHPLHDAGGASDSADFVKPRVNKHSASFAGRIKALSTTCRTCQGHSELVQEIGIVVALVEIRMSSRPCATFRVRATRIVYQPRIDRLNLGHRHPPRAR